MTAAAGGWCEGPIWGFDLETTSTDVGAARIVSAAVVGVDPAGSVFETTTWLADAGVDIPEAAVQRHGISTAQVRRDGRPILSVVGELVAALEAVWVGGHPVAGHNICFDLSVLAGECRRVGLPALQVRGPLLDTLVLDYAASVAERRPISLNLASTCRRYRVEHRRSHSADGDAQAAARLARAIGSVHVQQIGGRSLAELDGLQARWRRHWAEEFGAFLRRRGEPDRVVREWPMATDLITPREPWRPTIWNHRGH